jgi:hypothetical protein
VTDVASRIAAASGDAGALLVLAIELANENARLAGHAAALEEAELDRKAAVAERKRRQRHGTSRDVTGQSATERDITEGEPGETVPPPAGKEKSFIGSPPKAKATTAPRPAVGQKAAGETWITPYADAWKARFGGALPIERSVRPLALLRGEHGDGEVLRRWKLYLADQERGKFATAQGFASTWGEWDQPPQKLALNGNHKPSAADLQAASMLRIFTPSER